MGELDINNKTLDVKHSNIEVPFTGSSNSDINQIIDDLFNATTFSILLGMVALYVVFKIGSAIFISRRTNPEIKQHLSYSRTIDIILGTVLLLYSVYWYNSIPEYEQENTLGYLISRTQAWLDNPWSLFELVWFTIIFFTLIYILRVPMMPGAIPVIVNFIERKIWVLYAIFAIIYFFKYVLNIPIITLIFNNSLFNYFKNLQPSATSVYNTINIDLNVEADTSTDQTSTDQTSTDQTSSSPQTCTTNDNEYGTEPKQVFNVSNNLYTYEEAQEVCKAFDSSLATYDQIEASYQNGGEWCNYGWSDGQMGYFPTQKSTWANLQKNSKTKNSCGRPGINGGFIDNPYVRFGANCYGIKPTPPENWVAPVYDHSDLSDEPIVEDKYSKIRNGVNLNGFNLSNWSRY
jgi:hypothetical protein